MFHFNSTRSFSFVLLRIVLLLLFCFPYLGNAQHYNFKSYSVEEGLAQSQVYSVLQDKQGYLWVGTADGGVCRYDGNAFVNFTKRDGLAGNTVNSMLEDEEGNIWFATSGGLSRFDRKKIKSFSEGEGVGAVSCLKIFSDKKGRIWVGTLGKGVLYSEGKNKFVPLGGVIKDLQVWSIIEDLSGLIWLGTDKGVYLYDGKTIWPWLGNEKISQAVVYSLLEDSNNNIWMGTSVGLIKYTPGNIVLFDERRGVASGTVWALFEDHNRKIWIGTSSGVAQLNGDMFKFYNEQNGLSNNVIYCITEDREGSLWMGTNGGGIVKFAQKYFVSFNEEDGLSDKIVSKIIEDRNKKIWFGTYSGVTVYDGKKFRIYSERDGLINKKIFDILHHSDGTYWFTSRVGVSEFDGEKRWRNLTSKNGLPGNVVYNAIEDKNKRIWFGTQTGVGLYDGKNILNISGRLGLLGAEQMLIRHIFRASDERIYLGTDGGAFVVKQEPGPLNFKVVQLGEKDGLMSKKVRSITEDKEGDIWFGTVEGLFLYDKKEGKIKDGLHEKDGLLLDEIELLYCDNKNQLWIGGRKGISRFDINLYKKNGEKVFRHYGKSEGFSGVECNHNAVTGDSKGNIWFGTIKGAIKYDPSLDFFNEVPPVTSIYGIRLFYEKSDLSPYCDSLRKDDGLPVNLELPYRKNHVTFDYIGISLVNPEKVRYQYKLEGLDNKWSPSRKETSVSYTALPPGEYTFMVRACNNDGIWNKEPVTFSFIITPPFWLRPWFIVLVIIVILVSIYTGVRLRLRNLVKQRQILEQKVELRTFELKKEKEKVESYNQEIIFQKEIIEKKNKDITDSILYAKRIQHAILPDVALLKATLPESFVMFMPKDIVSGDFYWFGVKDDKVIIAAVDCTGHGVPGAFMSMIGYTLLNEIVLEKGITEPSEILNNLHLGVKASLKQNTGDAETNDGMDIALFSLDKTNNIVKTSAAYRPVYYIRDGELNEIKGDKYAIGGNQYNEDRKFHTHTYEMKKGDIFYLFTDGYSDQFGGKSGKKFLSKRFQELLLSIHTLDMDAQRRIMEEQFLNWKGNEEQVDDILVIGIRI